MECYKYKTIHRRSAIDYLYYENPGSFLKRAGILVFDKHPTIRINRLSRKQIIPHSHKNFSGISQKERGIFNAFLPDQAAY
jgi:hypothetical protein